ncbi:MAG: carbamoyl-phosphate synthase small subunit [Myxococcales bacterium]|nr:carbamoyl-phosphate synthase small subunit [Myxococcales bacterium]
MRARLLLEDGRSFVGEAFGAAATRVGEIVFNTAMTGYQEVLTDPSYTEQIVVMTTAQVGNYGMNARDDESGRIHPAGFVAREFSRLTSNHNAEQTLLEALTAARVPAIHGIDTRAIVRHIRSKGAMRAALTTEDTDDATLRERIHAWPGMAGRALATEVSTPRRYTYSPGPLDRALAGTVHVLDGGVKRNQLRLLVKAGCRVEVFPAGTPPEELADGADAVFLSNGPGDPSALPGMVATVRALLGKKPLLGVCLGHQLLGLALGADTFKLRFGHRGGNHPVRDLITGRIEITSQNHGFCVDPAGIERAGGKVTHVNLNDGTLEGFCHEDLRVACVQFHPEAMPGPRDSEHLLVQRFLQIAGIH